MSRLPDMIAFGIVAAGLLAVGGCPKSDPVETDGADTDTDTDTDTDADTDADSDADTDADADADSDADADADTDSDTDTDTDVDDQDGDGVSVADGDCDDADPTVFPGAPERCDGIDNQCDGSMADFDNDGDGDGALDCMACDAGGFYAPSLDTSGAPLVGTALVTALNTATSGHDCTDYSDARIFMFDVLDPRPDGLLEGVYTGLTATPDGTTTPGTFNTEHTWPQSQGAGNNPARCDLNHLYPTDSMANTERSNLPFGNVVSAEWSEGGSSQGTDANGDDVFEPRDVQKGNTARSILYFSMRYDLPLDAAYLARMKAWHDDDPPDDVEIARSEAIAVEQGAGNPYVVCPWLVDGI